MKITKYTIIIILFFSIAVLAPTSETVAKDTRRGSLSITDIRVQNEGENLQLSFNCAPDQLSIKKKERLVITPVVSDGVNRVEFEPFVVVGKRAKVPYTRSVDYKKEISVVGYEQVLAYDAGTKYEDWMKGGVLTFESSSKLCCTVQAMLASAVDGRILEEEEIEYVKEVRKVKPVSTTAEKLQQSNPFLAASSRRSEFDPENRDKSITILFPISSHTIDPDFQDNVRSLERLTSVINTINNSSDSRISGVLIVGYASPEGDSRFNASLAERRVVSLRDYLVQTTDVTSDSFEMINGGIDWFGLRQLVEESNMSYKKEVLDVINDVPVWDSKKGQGRKGELMRLKGGEPYRYMLQNFFPQLRSGTCITVYYENKTK